MESTEKLSYTQPNYDLISKKPYWTVNEALVYLAFNYLRDKSYDTREEAEVELKAVGDNLCQVIVTSIETKDLPLAEMVYTCDETGEPTTTVNIHKSKLFPHNFVFWALGKGFPMPDEFKMMLAGYVCIEPNQPLKEAIERAKAREEEQSPARIIDCSYQAVLYCFHQEQEANLAKEKIATYLSQKGFEDIKDETLKLICDQMPEEIRTVALPLDAKKKRHYGILAKKDTQVGMAISATVEALEYLDRLEGGGKVNQHDLYQWLAKSGYKELTDSLLDLIWQAIPPRYKKASKTKQQ